MKIGLYFGSFNPIHLGHLIVANGVLNLTDLQRIWFIVSPQNPLKNSKTLLNEYHRLHLVRLAIEDNNKFKASDVEFKLPRPSYTIDTLTYFKEKYKEHEFNIVMGSDSFQNISRWKNYSQVLAHPIIIYTRPGFESKVNSSNHKILSEIQLLDISSTSIRKLISEGKSVKYLVPDKVLEEIEVCGYYR